MWAAVRTLCFKALLQHIRGMIWLFFGPHCPVVLQFWENMFLSEHATTKFYQHSYQWTCLPQAQICGCLTLQQSARLKSWINSTSLQPPQKLPKFPCPSPKKKSMRATPGWRTWVTRRILVCWRLANFLSLLFLNTQKQTLAGDVVGLSGGTKLQSPEDPCMEYLPTLTPKVI